MSFGIPLMLAGLAGVALPVLIHLFNRRRYDVVDWGAMQFLEISETKHRRFMIEEILLLMLRMGLIALLVLGLAAPVANSSFLAEPGSAGNRDFVLLFDGSYSMGYNADSKTAHELAKEWATEFTQGLAVGDRVALLQAKQQVVPVVGALTREFDSVRQAIAQMPGPRGGCDWPRALQAATKLLEKGQRSQGEIIVLSDGQRYGWADDMTLVRWELLARSQGSEDIRPRIWVVNLAPQRPASPPNWSLAAIKASRAVASVGQEINFRSALELRGQDEYVAPYRLRLEVDRQFVRDLGPPAAAQLEKGQVPFSFTQRFTSAGSHVVSVIVEPDPPADKRPSGYRIRDTLPGDNRRDFALEVLPALPVLLVDGDPRLNPKRRGTDFLRDALAPALDRQPAVLVRTVSIRNFDPSLLATNLTRGGEAKPRVLVLSNVARLLAPQREAIGQFLNDGGAVLVTLGERVDARHYNEELYRAGEGWLPAHLEQPTGDEAKAERASSPLASTFFHPALELFREEAAGGLGAARFPRWWKVTTPGREAGTATVALFTSNDPWLVEKTWNGARVVLASVPLDNSWGANLPELPAFAPLAHELIYYLAGARSAQNNIQPGQPLRYRPGQTEPLDNWSLQTPEGKPKPLILGDTELPDAYHAQLAASPQGPLVTFEDTFEAGIYRLETPGGKNTFYVAQPDQRESDLTPCTEEDRNKVSALLPTMTYENERERVLESGADMRPTKELWEWFLAGVVLLLCAEIWLTRRISRGR
ncbi:MAG TPA: BatA domain-containing protein [Gemmataceae bacterium]|nr:BatA domain-containing protein [Gemmataceae bacterium]